jgi:hypothetical protein
MGLKKKSYSKQILLLKEISMKKLIRNSFSTPDGTVLVSYFAHDYKEYKDKNNKIYMIDGGLQYARRSIHEDQIDKCLYDDESHKVQREVLCWGTFGPLGDQPMKYISISSMDTDHIDAVLRDCAPTDILKNCMKEELEYRADKIKKKIMLKYRKGDS